MRWDTWWKTKQVLNDPNNVEQNPIKNEENMEKPEKFCLSCFHGKMFFGDDCFQTMFLYHPKFIIFVLGKDKGNEYVIALKSGDLFKSSFFFCMVFSYLCIVKLDDIVTEYNNT